MRLRLLAFLFYFIIALILIAVLAVIIDETMSENETRWQERTREFEQAVSPRPNEGG